MKDIIVYDHSKDLGNVNVTIADSGQMYATADGNTLVFQLYSGFTFDEDVADLNIHTRPLMRLNFQEQILRFDISDFAYKEAEEDRYEGHYKMLDIKALNRNLDTLHKNENTLIEIVGSLAKNNFAINAQNNLKQENFYSQLSALSPDRQREIESVTSSKVEFLYNEINSNLLRLSSEQDMIRRHQIELHRKFTLSVACLILFFIGAPLGAIIRKGGLGMPIVVSALAFIIYYIVGTMGENAAREEEIPIWVGMWLSTFIFLPIGLFLTAKATTDAGVMNAEVWSKMIEKIVDKIKKIYKKKK